LRTYYSQDEVYLKEIKMGIKNDRGGEFKVEGGKLLYNPFPDKGGQFGPAAGSNGGSEIVKSIEKVAGGFLKKNNLGSFFSIDGLNNWIFKKK
jgi:hypothetical protein